MIESKVIKTSKYFTYTLYDNGDITKTTNNVDFERESPLSQYEDENGIYVWLGKNKQYVKSLVARNFLEGDYWSGCVIEHLDGNANNCAADNLRCVHRDKSGDKKVYTKVSVNGIEYDSIAAAERALFVSQGYLSKYFKGQVAGKVIEGYDVKLMEE